MILNELLSILCTMGLPALDESLGGLLSEMDLHPLIFDFEDLAKSLGATIAAGVGMAEALPMMLGRRPIDVFKILRILILGICITQSTWIVQTINIWSGKVQMSTQSIAENQFDKVAQHQLLVAELQGKYLDKLRAAQDSIAEAQKVQEIGEDANAIQEIVYSVSHLGESINNNLKRATFIVESKVSEVINDVIRFIGLIIFQLSVYGILLAQKCFMAILGAFCPLMFAFSVAPPFRNAWSQWLSKYLSLSLWGFVAFAVIYYAGFVIEYFIRQDEEAYLHLTGQVGADNSWDSILALGVQGIGTTCMFVVGLMIGAFMLKFVPEVASWLIPGGVSSSAGAGAGGIGTSAASAGASAAGGAIGGAWGAAKGTANFATQVAGTHAQGAGVVSSIAQNTTLGQKYDQGRHRGLSGQKPQNTSET